jgi:hypothetical protein
MNSIVKKRKNSEEENDNQENQSKKTKFNVITIAEKSDSSSKENSSPIKLINHQNDTKIVC